MTQEELCPKIFVENTPDIIICLARAIQELQELLAVYTKYTNVRYWHDLYDDVKTKYFEEINARVSTFSHSVNVIDSCETYISLNEDERLKYVCNLFFRNIDITVLDSMVRNTDPGRFIVQLPQDVNARIAYDVDARNRIYWDSICPHHDSLMILRRSAIKLKTVCTGINAHICDVEQNELIKEAEKRRCTIVERLQSKIGMVNDIYCQLLVCMQLFKSFADKTAEIGMRQDVEATRDLQYSFEALYENSTLLNADTILSSKSDKELAMVSSHKKKYLDDIEIPANSSQQIIAIFTKCEKWLTSTCDELIAHYNGDAIITDRQITKETRELFGDDNSKRFRIMEIALSDVKANLVTWNYVTNHYEWHGSNQQLAFFMGALFLGDRISNGEFVFGKDLKGTDWNALVSQYWPSFNKTDFAQTRSMMKGGKAYPTDENYIFITGWLSLYGKTKRLN